MATYNGHNEDSSGNILLPLANGMVAKVETGTTASQVYTKGTYFYANNRFCKAKTDIASGDTLTSGTNYTATSVGAEMKSHLQLSDGSKEFYFDYQNSKYGWNEKADRSGTFHPFGGTDIEMIAHGNSKTNPHAMQDNVILDSTYLTKTETGASDINQDYVCTLKFKKACSGIFGYNYCNVSGTATRTMLVSTSQYSDMIGKFTAAVDKTIIFTVPAGNGNWGGYFIII